jgi:CSLREA domain-containing protein
MHSNFPGVRRWVAAVAAAASLGLSGVAGAATIYVTSTADLVKVNRQCSLREAFLNAHADNQSGSVDCVAGTGVDEIVLPEGVFFVSGVSDRATENDPALGDLDVTGPLTLRGAGAGLTILNGNGNGRIFDVRAGGELAVRDLTLTNGVVSYQGGGALRVASGGSLLLLDSQVTESGVGVGSGPLSGGAIHAETGSLVDVERSLLARNRSVGAGGYGGAISCEGCVLRIASSTLSNNWADSSAGALYVSALGSAELDFVTIADNYSEMRPGVEVQGSVVMRGVLLADNGTAYNPPASDSDLYCHAASMVTAQHSLVERIDGDCGGLVVDTRASLLGGYPEDVLADLDFFLVESPTRTQVRNAAFSLVLQDVFDAGTSGCPLAGAETDQIGGDRVVRGKCDFGAVELPQFVVDPPQVVVDELTDDGALGGTTTFEIHMSQPSVGLTRISLTPLQSAGELCTVSTTASVVGSDPVFAEIAAGDTSVMVTVHAVGDNAGAVGPDYTHACVVGGTVVASGDAALIGEVLPEVQVEVIDDDSDVPVFGSDPAPGGTFDVGLVSEGSMGRSYMLIRELGREDLQVTGVSFGGAYPGIFGLSPAPTPTTPFTVTDGNNNARWLGVTCSPLIAGTYTATMTLHTNAPDPDNPGNYLEPTYDVTCKGVQAVSLGRAQAMEGRDGYIDLVVRLGRPLITDSLDVVLDSADLWDMRAVPPARAANSATEGVDYEPLVGYVVSFRRGELEKHVRIRLFDDDLVEVDERFTVSISSVDGFAVASSGVSQASVVVQDDDRVKTDVELVSLDSLGGEYTDGELLYPRLRITNNGPSVARNISFVGAESPAVDYRYATVRLVAVGNDSAPVPAPGVWLPGEFAWNCRLGEGGGSIRCNVRELGPGRSVIVEPRIRLAEIDDGEALDYARGELAFSVAASNPEDVLTNNELKAGFEVRNPIAGSGGGVAGGLVLGALALLAARRTRQGRL